MMMNTTLDQLRTLKLDGLVIALEEQLAQPGTSDMSFEERLTMLVDREVHYRLDRRQQRLLKQAKLKCDGKTLELKVAGQYRSLVSEAVERRLQHAAEELGFKHELTS